MAKIDKLLEQMSGRNVSRAVMGSDQAIQLEASDGTVNGPYLSGAQLQELLLEILPPSHVSQLLSGSSFQFDYQSLHGSYNFNVENSASGTQVTVAPSGSQQIVPQPTPYNSTSPAPILPSTPTENTPSSPWTPPPPPASPYAANPPAPYASPDSATGYTSAGDISASNTPTPPNAPSNPYGAPSPPPQAYGAPPSYGHSQQGYPAQDFPPQGFPAQGFPGQGFPGQSLSRPQTRSKIVGGLLGIFLGGLGIHRFYLGYTNIGVVYLLLSLVLGWFTCGISSLVVTIIGFIEGIIIIVGGMKDAEGRDLVS